MPRAMIYFPGVPEGKEQEVEGDLDTLRGVVGGCITSISFRSYRGIHGYVHDEGILIGLPYNRNFLGHEIVGPAVFFRDTPDGDVTDLTDADVVWLRKHFDQK